MKVTKISEAILILKLQFSCDVEKSNIKGFEWVVHNNADFENTHFQTTEKLIEFVNEIFRQDDLIDKVIDQIKYDINVTGDITAVDELLRFVPLENLLNFLPHNL